MTKVIKSRLQTMLKQAEKSRTRALLNVQNVAQTSRLP